MKRFLGISLMLIVLLAVGAMAADDIGFGTFSSTSQKPGKSFTTTVSVINNGTTALNSSNSNQPTVSLASGLSTYNISLSPTSFDLDSGASQTVTITGTIPDDVDLEAADTATGTFQVTAGSLTRQADLTINLLVQLQLDNVKAKVDGDRQSIDDGDKIDEVKPGSTVEFTGDIENLFTDNDDEDFQIEDVEVEITIEDIEDEGDDDAEETEDVGDIDADDEESFKLEFDIPDDVDEGDYDVVIKVEGKDEEGANHYIEWKLTLEVEKEKHDIVINKASFSPSKIACSRDARLFVELKNQGREDEDEVVLRVFSDELDIDREETSIPELEDGTGDDTEYEKTISFRIADSVKPGVYPVRITSLYDTDEHSNEKTIDLTVEECATGEEDEEEADDEDSGSDVVVVTPTTPSVQDPVDDGPVVLTEDFTETTENSGSRAYLALLIVAIVVAVIVVVVLLAMLLKMRQA